MKENYSPNEYNDYDEYKVYEAEQYYKPENMIVKENKSPSENALDSSFSQSEVKKALDVESAYDKMENVNNLTNTLKSSGSTIIGTVSGAVAGTVGVVVVCSNFLAASPKMEILNLDIGCDYISYSIDVSELSEDINYSLRVNNAYTDYVIEVSEGINTDIISGLKPYTEYSFSLVSDNKDLGGYIEYETKSFYTLRADMPEVALLYDVVPSEDLSCMELSYKAYVSDMLNIGSDYYLEIESNGEVIYINDTIDEDSYFIDTITDLYDDELCFNVYGTLYDEVQLIFTEGVKITPSEDINHKDEPVERTIYDIFNDATIDSALLYSDGEKNSYIDLELNEYSEEITYKASIYFEDELFDSYLFTDKMMTIELGLSSFNRDKIYIKLEKSYEDLSDEASWNLKDLFGVEFNITDLSFDSSYNMYLAKYEITSDINEIEESRIVIKSLDNINIKDGHYKYSKEGYLYFYAPSEEFILSANIQFSRGDKSCYVTLDSEVYEYRFGISDISYGNNQSELSIRYAAIDDSGYSFFLYMDGEEIYPYEQLPGKNIYYIDDVTQEYEYVYAKVDYEGQIPTIIEELDRGSFKFEGDSNELATKIRNADVKYSPPRPGMQDTVTYNEDGTINIIINTRYQTNDDNAFLRIVLSEDIYLEPTEYDLFVEDLGYGSYGPQVYSYYRYNGINYYMSGYGISGSFNENIDTYISKNGIIEIRELANQLFDVEVLYSDGSTESLDVTITPNEKMDYNQNEYILYDHVIYYDKTKTPLYLTYKIKNGDTIYKGYARTNLFIDELEPSHYLNVSFNNNGNEEISYYYGSGFANEIFEKVEIYVADDDGNETLVKTLENVSDGYHEFDITTSLQNYTLIVYKVDEEKKELYRDSFTSPYRMTTDSRVVMLNESNEYTIIGFRPVGKYPNDAKLHVETYGGDVLTQIYEYDNFKEIYGNDMVFFKSDNLVDGNTMIISAIDANGLEYARTNAIFNNKYNQTTVTVDVDTAYDAYYDLDNQIAIVDTHIKSSSEEGYFADPYYYIYELYTNEDELIEIKKSTDRYITVDLSNGPVRYKVYTFYATEGDLYLPDAVIDIYDSEYVFLELPEKLFAYYGYEVLQPSYNISFKSDATITVNYNDGTSVIYTQNNTDPYYFSIELNGIYLNEIDYAKEVDTLDIDGIAVNYEDSDEFEPHYMKVNVYKEA